MFLKKGVKYLKLSLTLFIFYTMVMFLYIWFTDTPLGKEYKMVCLEPGCIIWGHKNGIYGDVTKFSITEQYIIGNVGKPNRWMIKQMKKKDINENPEGYFIIDKTKHTKKIKMTHKEFLQECDKLKIGSCKLKYSAPFWVVYDPYYWYLMFLD